MVDPLAEYNMPQYLLREFKVTDARDGQSRTIRQFQFTDWPEQGVPKSGEGFIDFIGQVHKTKEQFGQEGPITVHCRYSKITFENVQDMLRFSNIKYKKDATLLLYSYFHLKCSCSAGVGRTGVFITLSCVLERMQYEGMVDVFQTVRTLRTQRPAMVQTEVSAKTHTYVNLISAICKYMKQIGDILTKFTSLFCRININSATVQHWNTCRLLTSYILKLNRQEWQSWNSECEIVSSSCVLLQGLFHHTFHLD